MREHSDTATTKSVWHLKYQPRSHSQGVKYRCFVMSPGISSRHRERICMKRRGVWQSRGCLTTWDENMFQISLDKLGVLLMLLMSYFQRGLTWWVAVRQRAEEENKERVWLELNTQPKPQRDRHTDNHLQHGWTAHVRLFWALTRRGESDWRGRERNRGSWWCKTALPSPHRKRTGQ